MSEVSLDPGWPTAPLREAIENPQAHRARIAVLIALGASLLLHAIAVYSLRFRREVDLLNSVPVELTEWPQQAVPHASEAKTQNASAKLVAPLNARSGAPALNANGPPATALGALWSQVCPSLDAAERIRLHLPDCDRPAPKAWSREAAAALRLQLDAAARARAANAQLPEIRRVPMDDPPKPSGADLSNGMIPRAYPNFGAGSKTGDEDADSRAQLKALWYLQEQAAH